VWKIIRLLWLKLQLTRNIFILTAFGQSLTNKCAKLKYIKVCDNVVVDALSCVEIDGIFQHAAIHFSQSEGPSLQLFQNNDQYVSTCMETRQKKSSGTTHQATEMMSRFCNIHEKFIKMKKFT